MPGLSHDHVWQGRFKSFPIQQDDHLLTVLCYVLLNLIRPKVAGGICTSRRSPILSPSHLPTEEPFSLDQPLSRPDLTTLRTCVNRQQPFGTADWQARIASMMGFASPLAHANFNLSAFSCEIKGPDGSSPVKSATDSLLKFSKTNPKRGLPDRSKCFCQKESAYVNDPQQGRQVSQGSKDTLNIQFTDDQQLDQGKES